MPKNTSKKKAKYVTPLYCLNKAERKVIEDAVKRVAKTVLKRCPNHAYAVLAAYCLGSDAALDFKIEALYWEWARKRREKRG